MYQCQNDWCDAGWGPTQATIRRGVRWSTYRAYLRRVLHEDNVHVFTHATAVKVCPLNSVDSNQTENTMRIDG